MTRFLLAALYCFFLLLPAINSRADLDNSRRQLEKLRGRIENAESVLAEKRRSELDITRELALVKKTLQRIDQRVSALRKEQSGLRQDIAKQETLIDESRGEVRKIGRRLEKRLIVLYKEGEEGILKILFSTESPTEMAQQYHYLTSILEYDQQLLTEYRAAIDTQKQRLAELESLEKRKADLLKAEEDQRRVATEGRQLQSRLLSRAKADRKELDRELSELKERAASLKALISRLEMQPKRETEGVAIPGGGDFLSGRGKLAWPVDGEILIGYGTQKDASLGTYYESNGVEIATPVGSPVRAVAAGKIVFADYFKGYGNLFILSHPGGYHTLYAQTDRMQKKLGEVVSAGDLLGYSGLAGRESVYFEIRAQGAPVNPLTWLKKQ